MKRPVFTFLLLLIVSNCLWLRQAYAYDFKLIDSRQGLSSDYVSDIIQDEEGFVWLATPNGLNLYDGNKFRSYNTYEGKSENVFCMDIGPENNLWLGTFDNGVTVFNRFSEEFRKYSTKSEVNALAGDKINDILCDSKGRMWIVSSGGLNCYVASEDSMYYYDLSQKYPNSNIDLYSIFEDSKGRIFIGTWWHSLFCLDEFGDEFYQIRESDGGIISAAWCINEDHSGNIWLGTWGKGLYKLKLNEGGKFEVLEHLSVANQFFDKDITFDIVYSICRDEKGQMWIGTDAGLGVIRQAELSSVDIEWVPLIYDENQYMLKDIDEVFEDAEGSLWLGTFDFGICLFSPKDKLIDTYKINSKKLGASTNAFSCFWEYNNQFYTGVLSVGFGRYDIEKRTFRSHHKLN